MKGIYRLAEKTIAIESLYDRVHRRFAGYRADGEPDFSVSIIPSDLDYEQERELICAEKDNRPPVMSSPESREELAVYRKIAERMPDYDTFLFHGSVIAVDGEGYLFTAKSGTGKSTHTKLWREMLGERAVMVNDDKPLIRAAETVTVFGTPYNGKHNLGCNMSVPLKAVCILTRAAENSIVRISKQEAYAMLLQQVFRPRDPAVMQKTLTLIDRLAAQTALYRLGCNMEPEAAEVAFNGMKG